MIWVITTVWAVCGVLSYGLTFAYFQEKYKAMAVWHRSQDRAIALAMGLLGPCGMVVNALVGNYRYGLRYTAITDAESWAEHQRKYPRLTRDDWRS